MIVRLKIPLEQQEYSALLETAKSEMRDPVNQIRFIVLRELHNRGLLIEKNDQSTQIIQDCNDEKPGAIK